MKKYLMTGMAAVALCAAFTSCSNNEVFDPDRNQTAESVTVAYKQAFISTIGKPAANQDWGFGTRANTRAVDANANEWADPKRGGWIVPDPLTPEQIAVVKKYFQTHKDLGYEDPQWTNYFMQQVYKGGTDPMDGYSPEIYMAADNQNKIESGKHMDHLVAVDGNFADHIYNFNEGDCAINTDVLDNGQTVNDGTHHSDKIILMVNSTTKSFGYANSNASIVRTEYTGLVSFQTIIDAMGAEANCLNDGWNRSFMGFDFEQIVGEECYANSNLTFYGDYYINDVKQSNYVYQYNGAPVRMLNTSTNQYCGITKEVSDGDLYSDYHDANNNNQYLGKKLNTEFIDNLLKEGYLPVENKGNRTWVKIGGCADGYYSDWIVTLTEAKKQDNTTYSIRVIGEDLSASDKGDFDFNDVVFDVALNVNGKTQIKLQAAGGTLPLIIGVENPSNDQDYTENEVHNVFGGYPTNTMINTNAGKYGKAADGVAPAVLVLDKAYDNAKYIPVYVKKNGSWVELTAENGEPASKIGVETTFQWVGEKEYIGDIYPKFVKWVTENTDDVSIWY